jgi:hypothetical protein
LAVLGHLTQHVSPVHTFRTRLQAISSALKLCAWLGLKASGGVGKPSLGPFPLFHSGARSMRKKIFIVAIFSAIFCFSVTLALADSIDDPEQKEQLAEAIRTRGYICRTCEGGRVWENVNGGTQFQVYCNGNSLVYRVVLTSRRKVSCVERWDDNGGKCK